MKIFRVITSILLWLFLIAELVVCEILALVISIIGGIWHIGETFIDYNQYTFRRTIPELCRRFKKYIAH